MEASNGFSPVKFGVTAVSKTSQSRNVAGQLVNETFGAPKNVPAVTF